MLYRHPDNAQRYVLLSSRNRARLRYWNPQHSARAQRIPDELLGLDDRDAGTRHNLVCCRTRLVPRCLRQSLAATTLT